jgi:hypothetical protein
LIEQEIADQSQNSWFWLFHLETGINFHPVRCSFIILGPGNVLVPIRPREFNISQIKCSLIPMVIQK